MRRKILCSSALLVMQTWLVLIPRLAYGQGNTWAGASLADIVDTAPWRLGAFRINAAFEMSNAGYDSDVYFGYLDRPVPDYAFSAGLPIQLLLPLSKAVVLDLFENPQYLFYAETGKERAWNNVFRGQVHFAFDRVYIQLGGGLSNVRERLSPELNVNVRQKEDSLDGTLLWQASQQISLALLYGSSRFNYSDIEFSGTSLAVVLNRKENCADFIAYFQPNAKLRFFADGQYGTYTFEEAAAAFKDARSYSVLSGVDFVVEEKRSAREEQRVPLEPLKGSISLGYKRFDILSPLYADGSGFVGMANVSAGLLRRTVGRASLSRDYDFSVYSEGTFYISSNYGAGISRQLSRRATLSYNLSFSRGEYPGGAGTGGSVAQNFRSTSHDFNLRLDLTRNLQITLLAVLSERVYVNQPGSGRNRNFFGMSLRYGLPVGTVSAPKRGLSQDSIPLGF